MTTRSRSRVRNISLLMILTVAGCKSSCNPTKNTAPVGNPVELTGTGGTYVEMTAAAAAPTGTGACKDGMILVASGNVNGAQQLLMGPVQGVLPVSYDLAGWSDATRLWEPRGTPSPEPPATVATGGPVGSDNQAARLANGDLLVMWNGSTQSALPNSHEFTWWNNWPATTPADLKALFPAGRNGYRAAQVFWRFSCTTEQWSATPGILDSGTAVVLAPDSSNPGSSQSKIGHCAELVPFVGGFDRPELYVDPWGVNAQDNSRQRILVAAQCANSSETSVQVFTSPDSGQTWDPSGIRLGSTPVAMTSTTNGRVLFLNPVGEVPVLHWSDDKGKTLASPTEGYDVTFEYPKIDPPQPDPHEGEQHKFPVGTLGSDVTGVGPPQGPVLSLARTGSNAAMAVYPAIETVEVDGTEIKRQVAAVVWVLTRGKDQDPIVVPLKIIRAQKEDGSVFMASFIEDDSPGQKTASSLLYWLETASRPTGPTDTSAVKMLARYIVFSGIVPSKEGVLSDAGGWSIKNRTAYEALGDYMKGAFYSHNDTLNFVPVWPQVPASSAAQNTSQVYMRVISYKPEAAVVPDAEKMFGARPATKAPRKKLGVDPGRFKQSHRIPRIEKR